MCEGKKTTSVKYQSVINDMKAHQVAKDKAKTTPINVTEFCTNVSLLRYLVKGTSTIEGELKDVKEDLQELEVTFTKNFDVVPLLNLSNVIFTPYSELSRSYVE